MPFEACARGGPPLVMPHAEYAIVEACAGHVGVELRRVGLDRDALIAPMGGVDRRDGRVLLVAIPARGRFSAPSAVIGLTRIRFSQRGLARTRARRR